MAGTCGAAFGRAGSLRGVMWAVNDSYSSHFNTGYTTQLTPTMEAQPRIPTMLQRKEPSTTPLGYTIFTTIFIYICITYYTIAFIIIYLSWMVFSNYDANKNVKRRWPFLSVREIPSLGCYSIVDLYKICSYTSINPKIMKINNYYYLIQVYNQRH